MMESAPCPSSQDGERTPPERCPRPLYHQDRPEEKHSVPENHQGEDLTIIKVEVKEESEELKIDAPSLNRVKKEISADDSTENTSEDSKEILVLSLNYKVEDEDLMQRSSEAHSNENSSTYEERSPAQSRQPTSSDSWAECRGPQSTSHGCRRERQGGQQRASQYAANSDYTEAGGLDIDLLIDVVQEREPLWNMGDRHHADVGVTRQLWEEVCHEVVEDWEDLDARAKNQARDRVIKRWRSLRDRFKREFNKEMQAPSGSGGRRSKYKYARALSFLRSTMVSRSTVSSTREPAELNPSGAILQESATGEHFDRPDPSAPSLPSLTSGPSVPSTSAGASWQTSLHEAAVDEVALPLPHPSDTAATYRAPLGSGRQRQRGQEKSYAPEFLHLNASFQNSLKLLSEQMSAGFNLMQNSMLNLSTRLDRMHFDASKSLNHSFFQAVAECTEKLSPDQQMHVMQACQFALAQVSSQAPPPALVVPPAPAPPPATVPPPPPVQYQLPALYQFPTTASVPPLPAHYH
ncbi:uncharacterized protein ACNLHF_024348 [Anomaloglossus baeobatrachus]|uniref:uncharacterized protein LOC142316918 n=1 Tax=Anomaloglossus baeobatrachus TaxID=238106 RepID=UPI003F50A2B0